MEKATALKSHRSRAAVLSRPSYKKPWSSIYPHIKPLLVAHGLSNQKVCDNGACILVKSMRRERGRVCTVTGHKHNSNIRRSVTGWVNVKSQCRFSIFKWVFQIDSVMVFQNTGTLVWFSWHIDPSLT